MTALDPTHISDGYHTMAELYEFRMVYNALAFNEWARLGLYDIHKSWRHEDGALCFGGGWFVVRATLPTGQISNHYPAEHWDRFHVETRDRAAAWDGHSPQEALRRMLAHLDASPGHDPH